MRFRYSRKLYQIQGTCISDAGNKFFVWNTGPSKKTALKNLKRDYASVKAPYKYSNLTKEVVNEI